MTNSSDEEPVILESEVKATLYNTWKKYICRSQWDTYKTIPRYRHLKQTTTDEGKIRK